MQLPPREFVRRWAGWIAQKSGWKGDALHLRVPQDLVQGDLYSWLHAAIKVLSGNDVATPYLPKGECLKLGSSLVFAGERIMRDWAKKKAVILSARVAAGDLEAAQSKEVSDSSSATSSSGEWSSSGTGSEGAYDSAEEHSDGSSLEDNSDTQSRASRRSDNSRASRRSDVSANARSQRTPSEANSGSDSQDGASADGGGSSSEYSEEDSGDEDYSSRAESARSGGSNRSSRGGVQISIGTRIKQQNQVRRVLGNEGALAADLAEMEEESRRNFIRERKEAAKQKRAEKKAMKKKGKSSGGKGSKTDKQSKVSFKEGGDTKKESNKPKKKKKHRRRRKRSVKVNLTETDEQRDLRRLLMVRDAIIKSNRPLREGRERIYRTLRMAAAAIITGVRSYRAAMGFFFKFKPPPELDGEEKSPKERMALVVDLFRQFLPSGFLVDFGEFAAHLCGCSVCACVQLVKTNVMQIWIPERPSRIMLSLRPCLSVIRTCCVWGALQAFVVIDALNRCMHAIKPQKKDGGRFRKRNDQIMDSFPKERLQFAQVTLTGLQLVLQELVSSQQPHLIPNLTDEQIDFQIKSWLHRCASAWTQISTITRDVKMIAQKEKMRLAMWEQLQSRVQKMRAEFNMQRTHVALLEVNRRKNLEKEEAAQQKKKELAEAIAFQKEAAKSKEGRRALSKLSHTTVGFGFVSCGKFARKFFLTQAQVARFEDIFREDDGVEVDAFDEDDDEESQEQNALNREKKLKAKKLANEVEMNLCMNILLQR